MHAHFEQVIQKVDALMAKYPTITQAGRSTFVWSFSQRWLNSGT
jgi:hypothetical protein